jgi:hypothetical protein
MQLCRGQSQVTVDEITLWIQPSMNMSRMTKRIALLLAGGLMISTAHAQTPQAPRNDSLLDHEDARGRRAFARVTLSRQ